jgi:hypothetical protein
VKGPNTVTWTATDGNNNTATSTQTVTVVDNQVQPANTNRDNAGNCTTITVSWEPPTATDIVPLLVTLLY